MTSRCAKNNDAHLKINVSHISQKKSIKISRGSQGRQKVFTELRFEHYGYQSYSTSAKCFLSLLECNTNICMLPWSEKH